MFSNTGGNVNKNDSAAEPTSDDDDEAEADTSDPRTQLLSTSQITQLSACLPRSVINFMLE